MKQYKRVAALLLAGVLLVLSGCASASAPDDGYITQDNLMDIATIEGELSGKEDHYFDIKFKVETTMNTVILRENGDNITSFSIQALNAETNLYETVYTQQEIGAYRYCALDKVTTDSLRIHITGAVEKFKITEVSVYNINHQVDENQQDFRVTAYLLAEEIYDSSNLNPDSFDTITDVILFGANAFDEKGMIYYVDHEIDGEAVDGKLLFDTAMQNLREAIGDRDVNIYVNFLGPQGDTDTDDWKTLMNERGDLHVQAFKNVALVSYIGQFVREREIDGVFFDYEYPNKSSHWRAYSNFLVDLKEEIGDKVLGVALADWDISLSTKAVECVDRVEIMAYDLFDDRGNHASFQTAVNAVETFKNKNYDMEKLDLGIPFYGRPKDGAEYWYSYQDEAEALGRFGNYSDAQSEELDYSEVGRYYNGYQMVYDKTAYALNYGVGGVMIWHYNCDLDYGEELSLLSAMHDVMETRLNN
ncbi:MAG: glycoside hydrolase family 18 protein [Clostridiales bacterium]|nr:glycoside hydrolase family 18 protein [Clostridiales bacterium]